MRPMRARNEAPGQAGTRIVHTPLNGMAPFVLPINKAAGQYSYAAVVTVTGSDGSTQTFTHPQGAHRW